ncbi:beta-N-acetylhexosaminidase family protein [Bacillus sp. B-jedd]|uniref:beta-N-acetylhexosaminidase family protein n=1 Tax=Bacillus sp. B-jedd TaxID=1476857 RepID=UPI0005155CB5|nr:beta-N-acetylglucosaminidase domain-containing protein [Bacillus sp. B-jedd]CEG28705.1 O-GlcNAcase NagJ precursor [Bacillus sp. B-jedd]
MKKSVTFWKKALVLSTSLLLSVPILQGGNKASAADNAIQSINPTPQEVKVSGNGFPLTPKVGIVTGENTDEQAVKEVVEALEKAEVKKVIRYNDQEKYTTPVTVWIGGPSENEAVTDVLKQMGVESPEALKSEGYVLASSTKGKKQIVLAGKDQTGTYYAAKSFSQLIQEREGNDWFPQAQIRDWPEMPIRGSIEGFYGPPWTHEDRLNQLEFYGDNKLNTYIYAPKDDPYHRENWREPYPEEELARIKELIDEARENHVKFTFSISPGQSICYSGDEDFALLKKKMDAVWDLGVRSYAIFLDDIALSLNCQEDRDKFGNDSHPVAAAHAYLLNRFTKEFIETHEGAERLITVPTDYTGNGPTPYRDRFAELLDKDTVVMWTGQKVVSEEVTSEEADEVYGVFKHDMLLWDNYPVNDFDRNSLFLGPIVGRDADLAEHKVVGLTANPMNEAEASKIPLYTIADYTWNPAAYNPAESWERSIQNFGGEAAETLKTVAANMYSSPINKTESLTLTPLIDSFWKAYVAGNADEAAEQLIAEFKKFQQAPAKLQQEMDNKKFLQEIEPYLEKLEIYGKAGEAAVQYAMAQKNGHAGEAAGYREQLIALFNQSEQIPQKVGQGVIKPFLVKSALGVPPLELTLQQVIDQFWKTYDGEGGSLEAARLATEFKELQKISDNIRNDINDETFLKAIDPYLQNLSVYGEAGEVAVDFLMAEKNGQSDEAASYKERLKTLMMKAYKQPQEIGNEVIKPFLIESMWRDRGVIDYRMLDGVNKGRGGGQLIQYTPAYGPTTRTNPWGYEITVEEGKVVKRGGNNSAIPENGYVLSIHADDWLRDNTTIGTAIVIEDGVVLIISPEKAN